jgi:hypothetical protein
LDYSGHVDFFDLATLLSANYNTGEQFGPAGALTGLPGFGDGLDVGIVLAPGLDPAVVAADLTVKYQALNGGNLKTADITVPEPGGLALLGLGTGALVARRRRPRTGRRRGRPDRRSTRMRWGRNWLPAG